MLYCYETVFELDKGLCSDTRRHGSEESCIRSTMSTVEVEGVTELARRFDGIVSGDIREVLPHPQRGQAAHLPG